MGKSGLFLFSCFALITVLAVGCDDGKKTPQRGKIKTTDKAKADAAAAAKTAAAQATAAETARVMTTGQNIPTTPAASLTVDEVDQKINKLTTGSQAIAIEEIQAGTYQLEQVINVARKTNTQNQLKQATANGKATESTAIAGHSFPITLDAENKLIAGTAEVFNNPAGGANMPANDNTIPVQFEVVQGAFPVVTRAMIYVNKTEKGVSKMALQDSDKDKGHFFVELQQNKSKAEKGAYAIKQGASTVLVSFKSNNDRLIVGKDVQTISAQSATSKSLILVYKKVAATKPSAAPTGAGGTATDANTATAAAGGSPTNTIDDRSAGDPTVTPLKTE